MASGSTFCKWCGKPWFHEHRCPEYFEKENLKVFFIQKEHLIIGPGSQARRTCRSNNRSNNNNNNTVIPTAMKVPYSANILKIKIVSTINKQQTTI